MSVSFVEEGATLMRYAMEDGVELVGEAFGDPSAPGVLLAHGGGQTRYAWSRVARRLGEAGWHAVALDLRGHGESGWDPAKDYSLERYGVDLVAVGKTFAIPPVLVGASLGGNAGLLAMGRIGPGVFRALVLVDITPKIDVKGADKVLGFMGQHLEDGFETYEEAAEAIAAYLPERKGRKSNIASLARYLRTRPDGRYTWHWDPAFIEGRRSSRLNEQTLEDLNTALAAIDVPILLVRGSQSELVNDESVAHFLEIAPHAEFQDVTGAGHMIVGDRNDVFSETLDTFLSRL
ncbi:alpha/beta fold hydrolase [Sinisalibacter aestuarii]|uniref:Peroxidase n=1 Tax=Sinisalibacter aestuarii TaxID=2949426 RepID=A0ABQ5LY94_9RHOB|nr:alpha/beta hydrolase [Sinisalibacter aestuarii]GKY89613.1 peroxidase [Sinisalibacter aestuarii]